MLRHLFVFICQVRKPAVLGQCTRRITLIPSIKDLGYESKGFLFSNSRRRSPVCFGSFVPVEPRVSLKGENKKCQRCGSFVQQNTCLRLRPVADKIRAGCCLLSHTASEEGALADRILILNAVWYMLWYTPHNGLQAYDDDAFLF